MTLMCRLKAGREWHRSMMESCPLGLRSIASTMAWLSWSLLSEADTGLEVGRILLAEPHDKLAVQVTGTRLQLSQKL